MDIKQRSEIPSEYKWKLTDIFPDNESWEENFFAMEELLPKLGTYNGKLNNDDDIFDCLTLSSKLSLSLAKLYQYARLHRDEDSREGLYQGMVDRAENLIVRFQALGAYISPELTELPVEELKRLGSSKRFQDFSTTFDELIRDKNIILSKNEEKLLSEMGAFADNNEEIFTMFDCADIKFAPVELVDGTKIEMSHGNYGILLQDPEQENRKRAFESMFSAYHDYINTLATNYAGNVKKDWFFAKIRGFKSALDYAMYCENVHSTCYTKLLEAVDGNLKELHRYVALRRRALGIDLNMYDLLTPIVKEQNLSLEYDDAVKLVKEALKVMGKEYSDILASAFESGWIDVYENKGKKSGAYSWGCYGVHPFVLLNYTPTIGNVFTVAHELGHSLHSYYSDANQPQQKAGYKIFVAEIASTVNEVLLLKHLLKTAEGDFKKYLLSYYLDMFRTTLFRQTMFSEFEAIAHETAEKGEPLTADALSDVYYELNKKYYGTAVNHTDLIRYEWARIPHFYSSFYVYKYATGITAAVSIADNILRYGEEYFEKYRKFLSAGGSLPPLDILRLADVDLETDEPYLKAMGEFSQTLDELEKLI